MGFVEKEMNKRVMPDDNAANKPAEVVKWFYKDILGVVPDRQVYARFCDPNNARSLVPLLAKSKEFPDAVVYTPTEVAELVYYLRDNGVLVETLGVVTIPELMYSFSHRHELKYAKERLEGTVRYLRGEKSGNGNEFNVSEGW